MPSSQPEERLKVDQNNRVSIYGGGKVSGEALAQGCIRIRAAFPKLPDEWYSILDEMLDVENFTDKRFKDAIYNLIKTCKFPQPGIAEIIGYDNSFKVYSYNDTLEFCNKSGFKQKDIFEITKLRDKEDKLYWKLNRRTQE